jgi:hypothetical protein
MHRTPCNFREKAKPGACSTLATARTAKPRRDEVGRIESERDAPATHEIGSWRHPPPTGGGIARCNSATRSDLKASRGSRDVATFVAYRFLTSLVGPTADGVAR